MQEVCKILRIKKSRTSPYQPQCDWLVKQQPHNMLATTTQNHPFDWEDQLPKVCMAYNTSVHSSTGYTPFYLMFGRQTRLPIDITYDAAVDQASSNEYATATQTALQEVYSLVHQKLDMAHSFQKTYYGKRVHSNPFKEGDFVRLFSPAVPRGHSKKLHHPWSGPHRILAKLSNGDYRIKKVTGRKTIRVVHFDRLKPCHPATRMDDSKPSCTLPLPLPLTHPTLMFLTWKF